MTRLFKGLVNKLADVIKVDDISEDYEEEDIFDSFLEEEDKKEKRSLQKSSSTQISDKTSNSINIEAEQNILDRTSQTETIQQSNSNPYVEAQSSTISPNININQLHTSGNNNFANNTINNNNNNNNFQNKNKNNNILDEDDLNNDNIDTIASELDLSDISDIDDPLAEFEFEETENSNNNNNNKTINEEMVLLWKSYHIIASISPFFPAIRGIQNPSLISNEIEKIVKDLDNLTRKREEKEAILQERKKLSNIENNIQNITQQLTQKQDQKLQLRSKLSLIQQKKATLTQKQADIQSTLFQSKENLERRNSKCLELKTKLSNLLLDEKSLNEQYNAILQHNESLSERKKQLEEEKQDKIDHFDDLQKELQNERELITQMTLDLNSKDQTIESYKTQEDEMEEKKLLNEIKQQKNYLSSLQFKSIQDLEDELNDLQKKYQNIMDSKTLNNEKTVVETKEDERDLITRALFQYYQGNESELDTIKQFFQWEEEDMNKINEQPEKGFTGFFKKGARFINRFTNSWSNWLIQAAESGS